jgi:hypothetical protein
MPWLKKNSLSWIFLSTRNTTQPKRFLHNDNSQTLSLDNTKQNPTKWLYKQIFFAQRKTISQTRHWISKELREKLIVQSLILGLKTKFAYKQPKQNCANKFKWVKLNLSKSLTHTNNHNISWFPKNNTIRTWTFTMKITSVLCKNTHITNVRISQQNKNMLLINHKSQRLTRFKIHQ